MTRSNWDETWVSVAQAMAQRSKCVRAQVGCVIVSAEQRVISSGYNGPPAGYPAEGPCTSWCQRACGVEAPSPTYDDCPSLHAEINSLIRSDPQALLGATAYVTSSMCKGCAKAIANSGIVRVVHIVNDVLYWYRNNSTTEQFLVECGLEVIQWPTNDEKDEDDTTERSTP